MLLLLAALEHSGFLGYVLHASGRLGFILGCTTSAIKKCRLLMFAGEMAVIEEIRRDNAALLDIDVVIKGFFRNVLRRLRIEERGLKMYTYCLAEVLIFS